MDRYDGLFDLSKVRQVASEWSTGSYCPLGRLAATGAITDATADAARAAADEAHTRGQNVLAFDSRAGAEVWMWEAERCKLLHLAAYVEAAGERGAVPGWEAIPIGRDLNYGDDPEVA